MTLSQDIELLSRVSLFEGFPDEQLRLLAFGSKRMFLRGGEIVFRDGAPSDGGYIVVSGQVDILVERNGRELILASQLENSLIGEVALITENRRVATALARTNCELIFIPRDLFKRMLSEYPHLAEHLHQRISVSVRAMLKEMEAVRTRLSGIADLTSQ
jgi:CRP-like cAMP-binding protein